ncbi:MAG: TlpA disulfide reductase family protein [Bryobacteraceae bacterium]|nr:TlpA disulfide reductase family protein [Bryobacteraceae bacterium]
MRTRLLLALIAAPAFAAQTLNGLWDATVVVNQVEIPFRIELSATKDGVAGAFFNGEERVRSTAGAFEQSSLRLQFAHYATALEATLGDDGRLSGTYGRAGRLYPFRAKRFEPVPSEAGDVPSIAGLWEIPTKSPKGESAWRLFVRQSGAEVTAAILRVDGDTGELSGAWRNGRFVLSHFSGARPSLLEVTPKSDGTLDLLQNGKNRLTALRVADARAKGLPEPSDPSRHTSVKDPTEPFRFSGTDLAGKPVNETDARFQGKVVLVNISGSWCPNCHDEAPFLASLYRKYRDRGLEIVTLSFEEAEQLANPTRLKAFIAQYGLEHTVLLGGEQSQVLERLPQAVNLNTWPATFFLGRDGRVRSVHAGFAGKATGEAHTKLVAELTHTVERLLAESVVSAR